MVNEHASRDPPDWPPHERRPGKKPRLSDHDAAPPDEEPYSYRPSAYSERPPPPPPPPSDRERDRADRSDRPDRVDRPDRPDRVDRPDRADRPDRVDRPDRSDRSDRPDRDRDFDRRRYDHRDEQLRDFPPRDFPPRDLPPRDLPPRDLPPRDFSPRDLPPRDLPPRDLSPRDLPPRNQPPSPPSKGTPPAALPPPSPPPVGARLLLANLSYTTTEEQIIDFFRAVGAEVAKVRLVKVTPGNRVNGNAYVWMSDQRSVDIALDTDGREFMGRTLRVSDMPEDQRTACVRGLRPRSTAVDVEDLFRGCKILDVRCRPVKGGPPDMNTWFVDFADEESFTRALAKDRSAPGLMICIATAQGRGSNRTPREKPAGPGPSQRDDMDRPMPLSMRDEFDRGPPPLPPSHPTRDDYERPSRSRDALDKRPDDRAAYDRMPNLSHDAPEFDRHTGKDRNGMGNGSSGLAPPPPPLPPGRGRSRSRSRSPPPSRSFDRGTRGQDRFGDHDRIRGDRRMDYDRGHGYREMDRDRRPSPPHDDRYRDRYDRGDRDRRDYRRDSDAWGDRDRDHRRNRDYDRDHGRGERRGSNRFDRHGLDSRYPEPRERRDRERERPLDPVVTAVLTNLPFCEDRDRVIDNLGRQLEDMPEDLKVREIIPVGRRCGACIVVFRDEESKTRAVSLQSITIATRKVNILPLEVPSVARVQKLMPGFNVDTIVEDMQRHYGVESLFVKLKQSDQVLLGVEDTRFLVRLLDIDGRPLLNSRYATVSYIPSRHYSATIAGRGNRPPDDYDDPNGRGGGSYRDRGARDARGSPGEDRRHSGDMGGSDRRDAGEASRRGPADRDTRGYHHKTGEWKLRISGLPKELVDDKLMSVFAEVGVTGVAVDRIDTGAVVVSGGQSGSIDLDKLVTLCGEKTNPAFMDTSVVAVVLQSKKRLVEEDMGDERRIDRAPKKPKVTGNDDWKSKSIATHISSSCSTMFHISPMTPSPADYTIPQQIKRLPLDPGLPETCRRLEMLRAVIESGSPEKDKEDDSENYMKYCASLRKLLKPQTLLHTRANTIDAIPPQVWKGNVKKGAATAPASCEGFLVLNSRQKEDYVRKVVSEMPKDINMERRVSWAHPLFNHILKPEAVVTVLKAGRERGCREMASMEGGINGGHVNMSKALFIGILRSLRGKHSMGIHRYTLPVTGKRYLALCIPPNNYIFEKLRVPWRYRDYAGHDSLLLVVGPKNPES